MQLTDKKRVATPVDWKVDKFDYVIIMNNAYNHFQHGDDCMILPTVKDEEIPNLFPKGFKTIDVPSGKPYIRKTAHPE